MQSGLCPPGTLGSKLCILIWFPKLFSISEDAAFISAPQLM